MWMEENVFVLVVLIYMTYTEYNEEMNHMKLLILIFFFAVFFSHHKCQDSVIATQPRGKKWNRLFFRALVRKIWSVDAEGVNHGCTQYTFRI